MEYLRPAATAATAAAYMPHIIDRPPTQNPLQTTSSHLKRGVDSGGGEGRPAPRGQLGA